MLSRRWMMAAVLGMATLAMLSGCKKKTTGGPGTGEGSLGGIKGGDITDGSLNTRPGDGSLETRGQFVPVYFEYDSAQVQAGERAKLEAVSANLKQNSAGGVIVEGHCDERGSREYNLALGERRAMAVRAYLVGLGLDGARIQTKSFGKEKSVALGHDEESWSKNRRAEFVLFK
ncbi:MAG: OmpA family protein [Kiritimatiellaeota bacterium]|nr:OmpA family protein [Kiritimatiellota bacterium]